MVLSLVPNPSVIRKWAEGGKPVVTSALPAVTRLAVAGRSSLRFR
jgi:hypothetical protein